MLKNSHNELLFNNGWNFSKQPLNTTLEEINNRADQFKPVGIPHDWLIYDVQNLYQDSTGWYKKEFDWTKRPGELVFICFDGVYMDSSVYVNNHKVGEWKYGYSAFDFNITEYLINGKNEIKVSVNFQAPNSRWYSGAGIYRSVWIRRVKETYIPKDGLYISSYKVNDNKWNLEIETEIICKTDCKLRFRIGDREGHALEQDVLIVNQSTILQKKQVCKIIDNPLLWDIESPYLYNIEVDLILDDAVVQTECCRFGFRTVAFTPDRGFFINDRNLKLNGVCEHHDFGCLGAAYSQEAMRRKIDLLKKMGANAIRISHNMPAKDLMELADESGMLIVTEAFDMWKRSKTPYDYARFFHEWHERDIASWVRRDRNHPSLILWSIGNEIYDTHVDEDAVGTTKELVRLVREHDPKGNAKTTMGSNYMPWENAQKCAEFVDVVGYNYSEKYYEEHHQKHPHWIIYGSETCSTVQSRGVYHFPFEKSMLADDDLQCSALGNSTTSWGAKSTESCISIDRNLEFSCGQFLWSGFDYIGEPTPYHTKNSYLGQIDTAGFPKDSYYIFQSQWTDFKTAPMVHIFPYWDFNEGQLIDVRICSNAPQVELFINCESKGRHNIERKSPQQMVGHWQVPYREGWIEAVAYDETGDIIARETRHSFGEAANIQLKPDKTQIRTDGSDLIFVEISMTDADGYIVENAVNRVQVEVSGAGRLVGLDNGDSTDYDDYKSTNRKLFSGKLLAVIAAGSNCGEIVMTVNSHGLPEAKALFTAVSSEHIAGASYDCYSIPEGENAHNSEIPVRKIELQNEGRSLLSNEMPTAKVTASILPSDASDREVSFSVVDDAGIKSNIAKLDVDGSSAILTALYEGSFKLRCTSNSGTDHVRVISELNFSITGMGKAHLDPYDFISGGVYTYSRGTPVNGNEKGVATARGEETQVGFENIDFGDYGSDEITVPIFALTGDPYQIQIWEGIPEQGGELVADVVYQKPSIWNTYQEETFKLKKRLRGISSICFVLKDKVHIMGFYFTRKNKAFEQLYATENDQIYGDSFVIEEDCVKSIGNNVTLQFGNMDFGEGGASHVTIYGKTPLAKNAIVMKVTSGEEQSSHLLEFVYSKKPEEQSFDLEKITGICSIEFVFLPGSDFDFNWFRFRG